MHIVNDETRRIRTKAVRLNPPSPRLSDFANEFDFRRPGPKALVEYLRQKSRPYLFSNTLPPAVVMGSLAAFDLLENDTSFVTRLHENTAYFRQQLTSKGVTIREGIHPIVPIIIGDTAKAIAISAELLKRGIYVSGFGFPVVPQGAARLRCQISAAHTREHLDRAIEAIVNVGREFGVVGGVQA